METRFEQLESLHWLWAVAVIAVVVAIGFHLKRRALERFASPGLLGALMARVSPGRQYARAVLVLLGLTSLVAAMIDPRWGVSYQALQQRGIDIVVVLDVSRSMLAEDVKPNRLERAKQFINDLVERLGGDRVGLVTFAGTASINCPLTVDYGAFLLTLDVASVETAPRGGSLLGDALRVATTAFTDAVPDHKAIIVFTDGEDHGSYPLQAVETLKADLPVPIYTVGLGDSGEGARIPVSVETGRRGRNRTQRTNLVYEGQEIWSKLDANLLRDLALASGGAYVPVGTGTVDMGLVYDERIEPVAKREYETSERKRHHARYQWFAGLALALLLVESFMTDRRKVDRRGVVERNAEPKLERGSTSASSGDQARWSARSNTMGTRVALFVFLMLPVLLAAGPAGAPALPPGGQNQPPPPRVPTTIAADAARALAEARYDDAIGLYDELRGQLPQAPEIPYNQGVAAYRAGALDEATEYFRQTLDLAADPALRARSAYNLGTTAHRRTLEEQSAPPAPAGEAPEGNPLAEAMEELGRAIGHYRDALDADPDDMDARANAEMAWNFLKQLEQMQQQQQQQGEGDEQDQDQQDQDQDQQNQDQQNQDQQNQAQEGEQGEQPPDQPQDSDADPSDQPRDQQQSQDQEGEGEQQEQDQPEPQPQPGEEGEEEQQSAQEQPEEERGDERRMSREEAERLLQGVRDKERRRREELARREAIRHPPVDKDW